MAFTCSICQQVHDEDFPHIGAKYPDSYLDLNEADRNFECEVTPDTCIIRSLDAYFVRGVIEIPVHDNSDSFGFGAWVSHKKENFEIYLANYDSDKIGPFFGWLNTSIGYYPISTLNLKTTVRYQGKGQRPSIIVENCDHPLSIDQRNGISLAKAWEIVHHYLRPSSDNA